jgi:hypothetical protein
MPKRIMVYQADGFEFELMKLPSLEHMQALVGGYIEQVTVLDRVDEGRPIYTLIRQRGWAERQHATQPEGHRDLPAQCPVATP